MYLRSIYFLTIILLLLSCKEKPKANLGDQLLLEKKYQEAINFCNQEIEQQQDPALLKQHYYNRARARYALHQFSEASVDVQWAILLDSSNAEYQGLKGDLLSQQHQCSDAIVCYAKALRLAPSNGKWNYKIGSCKLKKNEEREALIEFQKAESAGYKEVMLFHEMGIAYQRTGDQANCCVYFNKAASLGDQEAATFAKNLRCN